MTSGRKKKIMISCVTFETVKVSDPVDYYDVNKVHLIHYSSKSHPVYQEFYDQTVKLIKENCRKGIEIVEVQREVWDFSKMLREIVRIIDSENQENGEQCEIFVNISAGSPEYSAAATIASMMYGNVTAFSVGVSRYSVQSDDEIKRCYFSGSDDGKSIPVGLAAEVKEPVMIPHYFIKKPPEELVCGLRIYQRFAEVNGKPKKVTAPVVIEALKKAGYWNHDIDPTDAKKKKNEKSSNAVYFHREFIERWVKHQWIVRDERTKIYIITDEGKRVIDTFYTDKV